MKVPSYRKHSSGLARVTIKGKDILLGKYDSPESREKYARIIAQHIQGIPVLPPKAIQGLRMFEVLKAYLQHIKVYYAGSVELDAMKRVIKAIREVYATHPASQFGAIEYQTIRAHWMKDPKRSRQYINRNMNRTLRIVKWAVSSGMMPADSYITCKCVEPLRKGRSGPLRESKKVTCVDPALVERTLPHLTRVQADMIKFAQATGARPGEVCKLKPSMVDRSDEVWTVDFADDHKTAHHDKNRKLYLGPVAKEIIAPYLLRHEDANCFSPQESERQRLAARHAARVTPITQGNSPGTARVARKPRRAPGEAYNTRAMARFIKYACERAKLPHWHPTQLRHTYGTKVRKAYGLEAAQVLLGHSKADTTQIYAEADKELAISVAQKIGCARHTQVEFQSNQMWRSLLLN